MACWGWLTCSFIAGAVIGFAGCKVLDYYKNKK